MPHCVRGVFLASVCVIMTGCADITHPPSPVNPTPGAAQRNSTVATSGGEVPWFEDDSQVPAEYQARIWDLEARVAWEGAVANAYAFSRWSGNRGTLKLNLSILEGTTTVATPSEEHVRQEVFPHEFMIGQPMGYAVSADCGHVANFDANQVARLVLGIAQYIIEWSTTSRTSRAYATQPACTNEDEPVDGGGGEGGGGSGGGGTDGGDGTVTCETTTYEIQVWNGSEWVHDGYEYETVCY